MHDTQDTEQRTMVVGYFGSQPKTCEEIETLYHRMMPEQYLPKKVKFKNIRQLDMTLMGKEADLTYLILEKKDNREVFIMYFMQQCSIWDSKNSRMETNMIVQESDSEFTMNHLLQLNLKGKKVFVSQVQIQYMERSKRITNIHTQNEMISISEKLDDLLDRMPSNMFLRCHVSFVVNVKYVKCLFRTAIELKNGEKIPVSRRYYKSVRDILCIGVQEIQAEKR